MPLIVDGCNVLFSLVPQGANSSQEAIEAARERLLRELLRYLQATGQSVTVVFDQGSFSGGARREEAFGSVRVLHAHPPRTADDDIRRMVEISTAPQTLRVVTSDRELGRACSHRGAAVVSANAFLDDLRRVVSTARADETEQRRKEEPPSEDELRYWLGVFGDADTQEAGLLRGAPLHARRRPRRPS
jgi:predicted RNA-binding protein with PIN domain